MFYSYYMYELLSVYIVQHTVHINIHHDGRNKTTANKQPVFWLFNATNAMEGVFGCHSI